jgi:hypothetical protein
VLVLDPDELSAGGFLHGSSLTARDSAHSFHIRQSYWMPNFTPITIATRASANKRAKGSLMNRSHLP